jgi:uncharacterized protein YchJ
MKNNQPSIKIHGSQRFSCLSRYILFLTLLLTILSCSCSNFRNTPVTISMPDQSTPEAAVQSLLKAFNEGDIKAVERLIDPSDESNQMILDGLKRGIESGATMKFTQIETILAENTGEMARVQVRFHQVFRIEDEVVSDERSGDLYTLIKKGEKWYFIGLGQFPPPGWVTE